jgi:hypothetical protein
LDRTHFSQEVAARTAVAAKKMAGHRLKFGGHVPLIKT